jgi:hypothetical protein
LEGFPIKVLVERVPWLQVIQQGKDGVNQNQPSTLRGTREDLQDISNDFAAEQRFEISGPTFLQRQPFRRLRLAQSLD